MAAEVSSMVKSNGGTPNSEVLITMDLLGGLSNKLGKKDLDLDLYNIPKAWEISPDLMRCKSPDSLITSSSPSSSSSDKRKQKHKLVEEDEEKESSNSKTPPWKFMEESLELKLNVDYSFSHCQSVCTLDKVKSALQRAEKESLINKRLSNDDNDDDDDEKKSFNSNNGGIMFAAACPGCLMYVMTLKKNPICPRCNSTVPSPLSFKNKKPRIDLNASF